MNGSDMLEELCKMGFVVKLGEDDYTITNNLLRKQSEVEPKTPTESVPEKNSLGDLRKFIADCRIPFRVKGPHGGHYQLNATSLYSEKYFAKVLDEGKYEYEDMVTAVGRYYNDSRMSRVTLTNFFKNDVFENVMREFLEKKTSIHTVQENRQNNGGRVSL